MGTFADYFGAWAAGLLSFLSPCVFPLVPSYFALLAGASINDVRVSTQTGEGAGTRKLRVTLLIRSLAFALGFTLVFVAFGILFSQAASMIGTQGVLWRRVSGIAVMLLGLNIIFDFAAILKREGRFHPSRKPAGVPSAMLFGAAFGAGWSPCVGPMLASILFMAGTGSALKAGSLLFAYSLGLALPFVGMAVFFGRLQGLFAWIRRKIGAIKIISGIFLIAMGLAMAMDNLQKFSGDVVRLGYVLQDAAESYPMEAQIGGSIVWFAFSLVWFIVFIRRVGNNKPGAHKKRLFLSGSLCIFGLLAFGLEAFGAVSTAKLISSWLLYQGF
jgi:cytochrome c-type biogenesis protein